MPRLDGTGPNGQGSMTGRGMGNCTAGKQRNNQSYGYGRGLGRALGKGLGRCLNRGIGRVFFQRDGQENIQKSDLASLSAKATSLKNELDNINKIIDSLENK